MPIISTRADIDEGLAHLASADQRLAGVIAAAGAFEPRRRTPGFAGLARIIIGQQVSVASAAAIWQRFETRFPDADWPEVAAADDAAFRAAGLSAPKIRALRASAAACAGGLDLALLCELDGSQAHERLTRIKGIGPWTADIYLMFCLGHRDIFPVGDLALRVAVSQAFELPEVVVAGDLAHMSAQWSPWRSVAALLFWAYYSARRAKPGVPL
jgi:DNA-3-methyladenine glycosylase II